MRWVRSVFANSNRTGSGSRHLGTDRRAAENPRVPVHVLSLGVITAVALLRPASAWAGESADPNATTQASKLAEYYRRADERRAAKVVKLQAQLEKGGDPEAMATLKHDLARTYELMKGKGEDARRTYADILENHKAYSKYYQVAFRMGELHDCIILPGTKEDAAKAANYYEEAIATCPSGELIKQRAHLSLGCIYWHRKRKDEAIRNLEQAYLFDAARLKIDAQGGSPKEQQDRLRVLQADCGRIRESALGKLVAAHRDQSDPVKTLSALDELEKRYAHDPKVVQMIQNEREATAKNGQKFIPQLDSVLTFPGGTKPSEVGSSK